MTSTPRAQVLGSMTARAESAIYCLPGAGGRASVFAPWRSYSESVCIRGVDYPDFADQEPTLAAISTAVAECIRTETAGDDRPFEILGHSFGATIAIRTAARLHDGRGPRRVVVSSAAAPGSTPRWDTVALDPTGLSELAGLDPQTLAAFDTHTSTAAHIRILGTAEVPHIQVPILGLYGTADRSVTREGVLAWAPFTSADLEVLPVRGGHAWIRDPAAVADVAPRLFGHAVPPRE